MAADPSIEVWQEGRAWRWRCGDHESPSGYASKQAAICAGGAWVANHRDPKATRRDSDTRSPRRWSSAARG
jgi:hypothetical protein